MKPSQSRPLHQAGRRFLAVLILIVGHYHYAPVEWWAAGLTVIAAIITTYDGTTKIHEYLEIRRHVNHCHHSH